MPNAPLAADLCLTPYVGVLLYPVQDFAKSATPHLAANIIKISLCYRYLWIILEESGHDADSSGYRAGDNAQVLASLAVNTSCHQLALALEAQRGYTANTSNGDMAVIRILCSLVAAIESTNIAPCSHQRPNNAGNSNVDGNWLNQCKSGCTLCMSNHDAFLHAISPTIARVYVALLRDSRSL
ncbi:hypothetical protein THASP1DRAFT_22122 [Thamnocephalis sphaerospora]|uniref:Uncharacterized protein n=1 Tax=Thamnocephalis sphaerospora TaxID=78915 RepID=A0A4P9XWS3_9FUNG|nr:hypothetical protein THASP1DRAFT_22122 [Thamnocephalis sphaerospora]|eukprot:RKP10111.1 hypothetical protein THASP1DRAFT_22122 [Thamnocephalis sphaerospora]